MKELAHDIANLRYDVLTELLQDLSLQLTKDGYADKDHGRHKLSEELRQAANNIRNAWVICEKHMPNG